MVSPIDNATGAHKTHPANFGECLFEITRIDLMAQPVDVQVVSRILPAIITSTASASIMCTICLSLVTLTRVGPGSCFG